MKQKDVLIELFKKWVNKYNHKNIFIHIYYILNMNCIFICVFNQDKYLEMFYLMLESILIYGNLDMNTKILIYTSTAFMIKIKESKLYIESKILFEINDTYNNIDKACKARLDCFHLQTINQFEKILYLDTDILVKKNINLVFDICNEEILYVLEEEGTIEDDRDFWGKTLFGNEIDNYKNQTPFTSGIMLFKNCKQLKDFFEIINQDIINRPYDFGCYDQPYIVYNSFKYSLYNNQVMKSLVVNNDYNILSDKVIHHFPGGPGNYGHKIIKMMTFLNNMKNH